MKRQYYSAIYLLTALVLIAAPAWAADKPQPELKMDKIEVKAYKELYPAKIAGVSGLREAVSVEGHVLVHVKAAVYPQWTDALDNARVEAKDIKLKTDQAEILMIGYFERFGDFRVETDSFSAYRRSDWKEKKEPSYQDAVFAVPQGVKTAEFKLGPVSAKIDVPEKLENAPDPRATVKIEVTQAAFVDKIRNAHSVGDIKPKPVSIVTNNRGHILELKIKVTPLKGNGDDPNHFFWYTPWLGLYTNDGSYVPTCGEMFMEGLSGGVSHNLSRGSDQKWSSGEATFYFAVPPDIKAYKLAYLGYQVAEGPLQAPEFKKKEEAAKEPAKPSTEDKAKKTIQDLMKKSQ
ncbi:MAG: hypothetical protein AB1641_05680 [Thermodesulfobacteriota bacterium]